MTAATLTQAPAASLAWLRRKDPGLSGLRRAVRVALVACTGFYACRYGLHNPAMATYALFGTIALGALSQIPGSGPQQARTLIAVLPAGALLVTAGTLLSVTTWTATLGMFVLGFLISFVGVGGPRLVGLAAGMQLLYILPCFPPYAPGTLGYRLAGLALAVVLLAAANLVLWPDPPAQAYSERLGRASAVLAECLTELAEVVAAEAAASGRSGAESAVKRPDDCDDSACDPGGRARLAELLPRAFDAAEDIRPLRVPPGQRPASAGRRDRALTQAGAALRRGLASVGDLVFDPACGVLAPPPALPLGTLPAEALLRRAAGTAQATARWLAGGEAPPDTADIAAAIAEFRAARAEVVPDAVHPDRLRLGARALAIADMVKVLATAAVVARDGKMHTHPGSEMSTTGPFWYAHRRSGWLWWHRFVEHLTRRSVYFQGAVRLALALAAARLLAGVLDLSHGFWVLLAILTVLRTSAAETRSALRPALVGTLLGALVAAGLLVVGAQPQVYVVALPFVMVVGFVAGPLLGPGWAQGLFTVVIALVFAQLAPVNWRLAEARVLDVAMGAAIGVLIGLFAWPRGGSGELHRATADFLAQSAETVRETVGTLTLARPTGPALDRAVRDGQLAEASYALYQTERHPPSAVDWQATLMAGHHVVRGAQGLLRVCPQGCLISCTKSLGATAEAVANAFQRTAANLHAHEIPTTPEPLPPQEWPTQLGADLYHLADIQVWLADLHDDLVRLTVPGPDRRARLAALAPALAG